jgi:hypothetical protein
MEGAVSCRIPRPNRRAGPGECVVVALGVEHRTGADEEAEILCFEPAGVLNTGHVRDAEFTAPVGVAI